MPRHSIVEVTIRGRVSRGNSRSRREVAQDSDRHRELSLAFKAYVDWCFAHEAPPRVDELAQFFGMSRAAFSRLFKRVCGENASTALKRAQLSRAQELVRGGLRGNDVA